MLAHPVSAKAPISDLCALPPQDTGSTNTIVTARVSQLDTMIPADPKLPPRPLHFAQSVVAEMPGVECVALVPLSSDDPYARCVGRLKVVNGGRRATT